MREGGRPRMMLEKKISGGRLVGGSGGGWVASFQAKRNEFWDLYKKN